MSSQSEDQEPCPRAPCGTNPQPTPCMLLPWPWGCVPSPLPPAWEVWGYPLLSGEAVSVPHQAVGCWGLGLAHSPWKTPPRQEAILGLSLTQFASQGLILAPA